MQEYETIIWDWNGTLLNDVDLCIEIANDILKNHGDVQLNETTYKDVFGFPITAYYEKIGIDFNKESFEDLTKKFIDDYGGNVKSCNLHEDAIDVLNEFKNQNKEQFILTAAHKEMVIPLLEHYKINHFFKAIEGLDNHRAESKVQRGIELIKNFKINPETAVLLGDTMHDYEVAEAIGVDCILIAKGHQSKERLIEKSKNEKAVLNNLSDLIKKDYKRVSCNFYDQLELYATLKQTVLVRYKNQEGNEEEQELKIKTFETKNKEEFLISNDGLRLRLDNIISCTKKI